MTTRELERLLDLLAEFSELEDVTGDLLDAIGRIRYEIDRRLP